MGPVYFWHGKQQIVSPRRMVPTDRFLWLVIIITSRLGQMQGTLYKIIKCTSHIDINGTFGKVQSIFEQCQTQDCQGRLIIEYRVLTLDSIFFIILFTEVCQNTEGTSFSMETEEKGWNKSMQHSEHVCSWRCLCEMYRGTCMCDNHILWFITQNLFHMNWPAGVFKNIFPDTDGWWC